jgi:hypothetical protein
MKIAYILYWLAGPESGVFRKISSQIRRWIGAGHEVTLILAGPAEKREAYQQAFQSTGAGFEYLPIHGAFGRWFRWCGLKKVLRRHTFSAIYHRFDLATPGLSSAMQRNHWVVEINTQDVAEYGLHPGLRNTYNNITRKTLFSRAAAGVFATRELAEDPAFGAFHSVREVIPNGVDFADTPSAPATPAEAPVELLFMGSDGHSWHGVDKLVHLAKAQPAWKIHAVGVSMTMFTNGKPENINAPGKLSRHEYEPLVMRSTAGIGTLALHRKSMNEACPLKVREYLAYGLPVILGCVDSDIPQGAPYALHISNTEDNVATHLREIQSFVESWRGKRVPRNQVAHMDWAVKEDARLRLMARFAKKA